MVKIGVFGGTFDPPHLGHRIVAADVAEALGLDRLLWIPSGIPPHKRDEEITAAPLRVEMVRQTIEDDPVMRLSTLEVDRAGPSYTVDTIRRLLADHPGCEIFLIVGSDQFAVFDRWKEPDAIADACEIVVLRRPGVEPFDASGESEFAHRSVEVRQVDLSSTEVRDRVASGRPIRHLVRDGVFRTIEREGLYR